MWEGGNNEKRTILALGKLDESRETFFCDCWYPSCTRPDCRDSLRGESIVGVFDVCLEVPISLQVSRQYKGVDVRGTP